MCNCHEGPDGERVECEDCYREREAEAREHRSGEPARDGQWVARCAKCAFTTPMPSTDHEPCLAGGIHDYERLHLPSGTTQRESEPEEEACASGEASGASGEKSAAHPSVRSLPSTTTESRTAGARGIGSSTSTNSNESSASEQRGSEPLLRGDLGGVSWALFSARGAAREMLLGPKLAEYHAKRLDRIDTQLADASRHFANVLADLGLEPENEQRRQKPAPDPSWASLAGFVRWIAEHPDVGDSVTSVEREERFQREARLVLEGAAPGWDGRAPQRGQNPAHDDEPTHIVARIRNVMNHATLMDRAKLGQSIMRVLDSTTVGTAAEDTERLIEERLVVTDLCDMHAFSRGGRLGQVLRRAINFIEREDCFPEQRCAEPEIAKDGAWHVPEMCRELQCAEPDPRPGPRQGESRAESWDCDACGWFVSAHATHTCAGPKLRVHASSKGEERKGEANE